MSSCSSIIYIWGFMFWAFFWSLNCRSLVCILIRTIHLNSDHLRFLGSVDIRGFLCWHILNDKFSHSVIFQIFFLVCKLFRLGFFITTYFGPGQCFIWEFLVFAFIETTRLNTTSYSNFSRSWNDTVLVCKLCMSSL